MTYHLESHASGLYSVQVFDGGSMVAAANIVRDTNGWRVVCLRPDGLSSPQHKSPEAAAEWLMESLANEGGADCWIDRYGAIV
jgi:hypothetical protein